MFIFATLPLPGGYAYAQGDVSCLDPAPVAVVVDAVPIVVVSTTDEYFVLYVRHELDSDTTVEFPVAVIRGEANTTTLAESVEALPKERYRVEKYLIADPADVDGDCIDDLTELADLGTKNPVNPADAIASDDGVLAVPDHQTFENLAYDSSGTWNLKFVLLDIDTNNPRVYFQNTERHLPHGHFLEAADLQGPGIIRGSITYNPTLVAPDGSLGVYLYGFGSRHPDYPFGTVARIHTVLAASMPFLADNLTLWISNSELPQLQSDLPLYQVSRIPLLFDEDIFAETSFQALNPGKGYGLLRSLEPDERPNPRDVVLYETLPNELPRVAGIISTVPQTPLSHVNLRAIQDSIPNAFIRNADDNDDITALLDTYVRYTVAENGWELRAATVEEVNAHYAASRPSESQTPERDLSVTTITPLGEIGFENWDAFGVKAANVAVLGTLEFSEGAVPTGFAIPFYFYDEFMKANDFYKKIEEMLADEDFQTDFDEQEDELKDLRKKIKDADVPDWIIEALTTMHGTYPEGQSLRYRSSTNNEDLPGFNGAGLYDSKTQKPDETEEDGIDKSLKQVFASLWNFRAFSEREFHRVDHKAAAMGMLVHPNYTDELVNGVAVSFDPAYGTDGSYYVNSQVGEDLVTNPEAHSVPEEILLYAGGSYTVVATSNQVERGELFMSDAQLQQLHQHLEVIHDEFETLYDPADDEPFAMEIEFKITSDNILAIKQARPWVFGDAAPATDTDTPATDTDNALTASFDNPPTTHDGNPFSVRFRFSKHLFMRYKNFRDHAVTMTGGMVTNARRVDGRDDHWEIGITPDSNANMTMILAANRPCTIPGAICTNDGHRLSTQLEHTVKGLGAQPEPATTPSQPEPITTPPQPEPITTPPQPEPITTPPQPEPATTPPQPEPATTPPQPEPATTPPQPEPATTPPQPEPITTPSQPEPITTPPQPEPATTTPQPERLGPDGEGGGGCAIAGIGNTPKNTVFSMFLATATSILFPAISSNRTLSLSTSK